MGKGDALNVDQDKVKDILLQTPETSVKGGQTDGESVQQADEVEENKTPEPPENMTQLDLESLCNRHCSGRRKKGIIIAGAVVLLGAIIVVSVLTSRPAHSPVDKSLSSAPTMESVTAAPQHTTSTTETLCPDGWKKYGGRCYYINSTTQETWKGSRNLCQQIGADLVVINSEEKQGLLRGLDFKEGVAAWIGLSRNGSDWMWVDGTLPTTTYWEKDQPADGDGDCAAHYYLDEGGWNNVDCDYQRYWVCERL